MADPFKICSQKELLKLRSIGFHKDNIEGFVIIYNDQIYAYRNACPHTGINLEFSPNTFFDNEGNFIQCAMHGALFHPLDGKCVHGPCLGDRLQPIEVRLIDGDIVLSEDAL